jgi:hypothetical protein
MNVTHVFFALNRCNVLNIHRPEVQGVKKIILLVASMLGYPVPPIRGTIQFLVQLFSTQTKL